MIDEPRPVAYCPDCQQTTILAPGRLCLWCLNYIPPEET